MLRDDSRRRFLVQHSVAMLEQCCNHWKQCHNNVATLYCAKNRRYESSRVTSPKSRFGLLRPFPSVPKPLFQSEAKCEAIDMKRIFNYHANKTHFHNKGCAPSLVSKVRVFGTQKWPVQWLILQMNVDVFKTPPPPPPPANFEYCNFLWQVNERLKLTVWVTRKPCFPPYMLRFSLDLIVFFFQILQINYF